MCPFLKQALPSRDLIPDSTEVTEEVVGPRYVFTWAQAARLRSSYSRAEAAGGSHGVCDEPQERRGVKPREFQVCSAGNMHKKK